MINTTMAYRTAIQNNRQFEYDVKITFADGTEEHIYKERILSLSVKDAVSGTSSFDIGSAIINQLDMKIDNTDGRFDQYDFDQAEMIIKVGLKLADNTTEWLQKGIFYADPAEFSGAVITIKGLDNMAKFDKDYSLSTLKYPAALGTIVRDACGCCGVSLSPDSAEFDQDDFVVPKRPEGNVTFRNVLTWVGQIACRWCRCDVSGRLSLAWYDQELYEKEMNYDGGHFNPWNEGDVLDGGTFVPWTNDGNNTDGGSFEEQRSYHHIFRLGSANISTDDVIITGVRVVEKAGSTESEDAAFLHGGEGYILQIENNELIQGGAGETVVKYLGDILIGLRFRPLSVTCQSDPSLEAGDIAWVTDRKNRSYATLITSTTFNGGGRQSVSCDAKTPQKNSAQRYSAETKLYQELRNQLKKSKTEWEKSAEDLGLRMDNAGGLFHTAAEQDDKSVIYYLHDKKTLAESQVVMKFTDQAIGISTDGGKTWSVGTTVDGESITKILTAIGINATWINAGEIVVKDEAGNILFQVDIDSKSVKISGSGLIANTVTADKINIEDLLALKALIGGWNIDETGIYKIARESYTEDGTVNVEVVEPETEDEDGDIGMEDGAPLIPSYGADATEYEVRFRPLCSATLPKDTAILSCSVDGLNNFALWGDGSADFGGTHIGSGGEILVKSITSRREYNADSFSQITMEDSVFKFWDESKEIGTLGPVREQVIEDGVTFLNDVLETDMVIRCRDWETTSDERKKMIRGWDERYEKFILTVPPICFAWADKDDMREYTGIGAQTAASILKELKLANSGLVNGTEEKGYTVAYSNLHAMEIAVIQKMEKRISELENIVNKRKAKRSFLDIFRKGIRNGNTKKKR